MMRHNLFSHFGCSLFVCSQSTSISSLILVLVFFFFFFVDFCMCWNQSFVFFIHSSSSSFVCECVSDIWYDQSVQCVHYFSFERRGLFCHLGRCFFLRFFCSTFFLRTANLLLQVKRFNKFDNGKTLCETHFLYTNGHAIPDVSWIETLMS